MKIRIKSWEDIKKALGNFSLKLREAVSYEEELHLHSDWYDVVEEDETKEPEAKKR